MMPPFPKKDLWLPLAGFLLLIVALFLNLGIYPLYLEEPRRALIALEMLFNQNIWVPTEFGEYYYKKPPVYNWVIIAGYRVFGSYSEFAVRFFSVVSYLLMGVTAFWAGKKYVSLTFGIYTAFFFYVCSDLLFYFTVTSGEIDLFYSFITYLSFVALFYFKEKKQYYALFIVTYFLAAAGTLTKGLPSIVFQGISLLTIFIWDREFKKLFSVPHLAGLLVYTGIVGGYFWIYSQYNDVLAFFSEEESLLSQSTERTLFENSFLKLIRHLATFPLELIKILAPGSLLALLLFSKGALQRTLSNRYIRFCGILFLTNIWVYWISPGTASRYLYMLFPLAITFLAYVAYTSSPSSKPVRILEVFFFVVILVLLGGCIAVPFIQSLQVADHRIAIAIAGGLFYVLLAIFYLKRKKYRLFTAIVALIGFRIVFDLTILPVRAYDGEQTYAVLEKEHAEQIMAIAGDAPVFLFAESTCSRTTIFYIEKITQKVLSRDFSTSPDRLYIANVSLLPSAETFETYFNFSYQGKQFALIKFTE